MIRLGDVAKDRVTGFEGVTVARIEYLNGCIQYQLQPAGLGEKGLPREAQVQERLPKYRLGKTDAPLQGG